MSSLNKFKFLKVIGIPHSQDWKYRKIGHSARANSHIYTGISCKIAMPLFEVELVNDLNFPRERSRNWNEAMKQSDQCSSAVCITVYMLLKVQTQGSILF